MRCNIAQSWHPKGHRYQHSPPGCPNPAGLGPFSTNPWRFVPQHLLVPSCHFQGTGRCSQVAQPLQVVAAPLPQRGLLALGSTNPTFLGLVLNVEHSQPDPVSICREGRFCWGQGDIPQLGCISAAPEIVPG